VSTNNFWLIIVRVLRCSVKRRLYCRSHQSMLIYIRHLM